jgi:hypothetical protein
MAVTPLGRGIRFRQQLTNSKTATDHPDPKHVISRIRAHPRKSVAMTSVVIDHAQRTEAHKLRIVILIKRKGVASIEPAMVAPAPLITAPNLDHNAPQLFSESGNIDAGQGKTIRAQT